jgi:hypothetical protein
MSQLIKTKRQANFKDFKRCGAFKGLVEQKTLYSTRSCVNWALFWHSRFKLAVMPKKAQFTHELFQF